MSVVETVEITKYDVRLDPSKMGDFIKQELVRRKLETHKGCKLAISLFGNNKPFSNTFIRELPCMQPYKDYTKAIGAMYRKREHTKNQYVKRILKAKKKILREIAIALEDSSSPYHNILMSMGDS